MYIYVYIYIYIYEVRFLTRTSKKWWMSYNCLAELSLQKVMCFFDTPKHRSPGSSRKLPEGFPEDFPEGVFFKLWVFYGKRHLFFKLSLFRFLFLLTLLRETTLFYLILNKKVGLKRATVKSRSPGRSRKVPEGFPEAFPEGYLSQPGAKRVKANPHIYIYMVYAENTVTPA